MCVAVRKQIIKIKVGGKMKKIVYGLYAAGIICLLLFFCYLCASMHNESPQSRKDSSFTMVTDYRRSLAEKKGLPQGVKAVYEMQFDDIGEGGQCLMFYTVHQEVDVYVGEELVSSLHMDQGNRFGKTPGNCWICVPLYQRDNGKEICVELIPVYEQTIDTIPDFYYGSRFSIWTWIVKKNLLPFLLSVLAIFSGLCFLLFTLYNYKNSEVDRSLGMMGMFSMHIGIWKMTDMPAFSLFAAHSAVVAYLPFLSLLLVIIPFVLFVKELFSRKEHIVWYLLCFFSLFVTFLTLVLQIAGIQDMRQSLWLTHIDMAAMVAFVLWMLFQEWRRVGWDSQLRLMALCMALCFVGLISDLATYYLSGGGAMMVYGMFGFLTYVIILGIRSIRETKKLMRIGMKAKRYEQMAYHDQMTGLYNRTAYAERTEGKEFAPQDCIAVMFDLNDLKKCNDTQGHEQGDRYIICGAQMIRQAFEDIGNCYRMGGDEFCVLLERVSLEVCRQRIRRLKQLVKEHNKEYPKEFPVQIAAGYGMYDETEDFDFSDTLRRADKMMYHEKFMMKHKKEAGQ